MIIPQLYEDELLYSFIARYEVWNGITADTVAMYNLYGKSHEFAFFDLPVDLESFMVRTGISVDYLIHEATLFDYYSVFKSDETREAALRMICGNQINRIRYALGVKTNKITTPKYARFCPKCREEELKKYGESYWHRMHQVTGILICPKHRCMLNNSRLLYSNNNNYITTPNEWICFPKKNDLELCKREFLLACEIGKDIQWLFKNYNTVIKSDYLIQKLYLLKVTEAGFNLRDSYIHDEFLDKFISYYGRNLLNEWNFDPCTFWVYRILYGLSCHTLSHVLLIHFLFGSMENLFNSINSVSYTEKGWDNKTWDTRMNNIMWNAERYLKKSKDRLVYK